MPLFARRAPGPVPLPPPSPDGTGWPDGAALGRPSFDATAFHELALRNAYEIEAHAAADRVVDGLLPRLAPAADDPDAPYLRKVLLTAARIGAGLGMVDRSLPDPGPGLVDPRSAGALLLARRDLPAAGRPGLLAGYFLLAGFHTARSGPDAVDLLASRLPT